MSGINDFEAELAAISWAIHNDCDSLVFVTRKQVRRLVNLMKQGLSRPNDRKLRIEVLRVLVGKATQAVTGVEVKSTTNLTSPIASYLINQLKTNGSYEINDHGRWLIREAEARVSQPAELREERPG